MSDGDATVEVALDLGKVVAADREAPFCEIELEKKAGSPRALFALARKVDLITPVHLGVLSKAERGYRLLGSVPSAVKAASTPLTPEMGAATAFAHIAAACLNRLVARCRGPAPSSRGVGRSVGKGFRLRRI
ncbi:MAG: CYTH domain-containing protein [Mesorhizobium sp.]|uniref:CYTH domain-containing protein n=1 Tax=Mesorhizobium sp. TaxID=1871066 RepID=UPI001224DF73|nr:CYTH domain-containing protein [Mesorhizobium sp.]TIR17089.1 MAG: CYTH domain-containing protein [Mesorhizobium sp.]